MTVVRSQPPISVNYNSFVITSLLLIDLLTVLQSQFNETSASLLFC